MTQKNCTAVGEHYFEVTTVAPVTSAGVALLGELSKVVGVSEGRVRSVVQTSRGGLAVTVNGSSSEQVNLTFVVGDAVRVVPLVIAPDNTASVVVEPSGLRLADLL